MDDYKDLQKTFDYDKKKVSRLVEAVNERNQALKRVQYLNEVIEVNKDLMNFVWTDKDGAVTALHDLGDNHLENIIGFITRNGGVLPEEIKAEARSRGMDVDKLSMTAIRIKARNDEFDDDDFYDEDDRWGAW